MEYGLKRTRRIEVRVSPEEEEIFQRMADKLTEGNISDYLRWMGMWTAVKKGDSKALKMLREQLSQEARDMRDRFYAAVGLPVRKDKQT